MPAMANLEDRLREVMQAKQWEHADLVRISGQSSSVVSQWLGAGSKEIKRIARVGAAVRLAEASGYSAEWLAEGKGPRFRTAPETQEAAALTARERPASYDAERSLDMLEQQLRQLLPADREAVAANLAGWARDGGHGPWRAALVALLHKPKTNSKRAA